MRMEGSVGWREESGGVDAWKDGRERDVQRMKMSVLGSHAGIHSPFGSHRSFIILCLSWPRVP